MYLPFSFLLFNSSFNIIFFANRDASYTTQPLELLNDLGFKHSNTPEQLGTSKPDVGDGVSINSIGHQSVHIGQSDGNEGDTNGDSLHSEVSEGQLPNCL